MLSREDDTEWYEACNPLIPTARGLVPVAFFEIIGKQQRQSGQSVTSNERPDHDSGFSEKGTSNSNHMRSASAATAKVGHQRGMSMGMGGKNTGAMVYGVVQYDFNAERADELDAKAGEAIIVVAQSNPEWFVAKPIGRLGGPGLIPVAFVDIKDTATMKSVPDPLEAVRKAGVPRVEEWKKFAAEYKNSSISLGKFGDAHQVTDSMGRMSIQQGQSQQRPSQYVCLPSPCEPQLTEDSLKQCNNTLIKARLCRSLQYKHLYLDIVSTMTCIGTSSNVKWKMEDGSNYHDTTPISTISKSPSSRPSPKKPVTRTNRARCHSCPGLSPTLQTLYPMVDGRTSTNTSKKSLPCLPTYPNPSSSAPSSNPSQIKTSKSILTPSAKTTDYQVARNTPSTEPNRIKQANRPHPTSPARTGVCHHLPATTNNHSNATLQTRNPTAAPTSNTPPAT